MIFINFLKLLKLYQYVYFFIEKRIVICFNAEHPENAISSIEIIEERIDISSNDVQSSNERLSIETIEERITISL